MNIKQFLVGSYVSSWRIATSYFPYGENVYDHDWDLLIILDACRVDALKEIESEYDFINSVDSITSIGSTSTEWVHNTFIESHREEIQNTTYVTSNPFSTHVKTKNVNRLRTLYTMDTNFENNRLLNWILKNDSLGGEFHSFVDADGVKISGQEDKQVYPPDIVTASAIEAARKSGSNRMIVHYMQPHTPYISKALDRGEYREYEISPFKYLKNGGSRNKVWESYLQNLILVLDSVQILLENVDAEDVIITADHGELFGELGLYSHPYGIPHPKLRKVPWVKTEAVDEQTMTPDEIRSSYDRVSEISREEQLEALGYK